MSCFFDLRIHFEYIILKLDLCHIVLKKQHVNMRLYRDPPINNPANCCEIDVFEKVLNWQVSGKNNTTK